jgi:hypothetical protein
MVLLLNWRLRKIFRSVADLDPEPDPDPKDPYVFRPPESGSLYHQVNIIRKTLIPTVL